MVSVEYFELCCFFKLQPFLWLMVFLCWRGNLQTL